MEVLGRYSNTSEHLRRMKRTLDLAARQSSPRPPTAAPFVHKVSQRLSPRALDQLATDYEAGVPTTQLTAKYGLGKGAVLRVLTERGVAMRHQPLTNEQVITAIQLYECGASLKQVGAELGADHETVRKALKRAGIATRKAWERRAQRA